MRKGKEVRGRPAQFLMGTRQVGTSLAGSVLTKRWAGRGGHPPAKGRVDRDPSLRMEPVVSALLTDTGAGGCVPSPHLSSTSLCHNVCR